LENIKTIDKEINKLKQKGYEVTNTYIEVSNDGKYNIEKISVSIKKNKSEGNNNIASENINKIQIESVSTDEVEDLKEYICESYSISKDLVEVLS